MVRPGRVRVSPQPSVRTVFRFRPQVEGSCSFRRRSPSPSRETCRGQGISSRGEPRPRATGIVGQLPRVRGRTPGLPRGGDEQRSLPRRARLPRRHTAVGLISGVLLTAPTCGEGKPRRARGAYPESRTQRPVGSVRCHQQPPGQPQPVTDSRIHCRGRTPRPITPQLSVARLCARTRSPVAAEETDHPREVIEAALAHVVQNKVEAAYQPVVKPRVAPRAARRPPDKA